MPKVIKSGIYSPEYGFPLCPPAGLRATCLQCRALLETETEEKSAEVCFIFQRRENVRIPGWRVKCPECGKKVTIIAETISPLVFQLLNGPSGEQYP